jgi:diketogulonate reductase-like aldo/keto reductase
MNRRFGFLGVTVPAIGQGTWEMGSPARRREEIATLREGFERGLTHVDTAEMYGDGAAEELIGQALNTKESAVAREQLFLVSKVLPRNASRAGTIAACERSLRRLKTDYLDLYLLHWRGSFPLGETMAALETLLQTGKIRALGVSNFSESDLEEAQQALTTERIACNQVLYHLEQRHIDSGLVPFCLEREIAVVGYSPFGHGRFPAPTTRPGKVLAEIAARRTATPRQVALAFLTRKAPLFTIPKSSNLAHVQENAGALALQLDADDLTRLESTFPSHEESDLPML